MSDSSQEEMRASEQKIEEQFRSLGWVPDFVEIPRPNSSHGDRSEAVPSVGDDQWQERGMPPAGCDPPTIREHSGQPHADHRELGGQREWEVRSEWRDQRAFFPGSEFADGVAAAGSGHAGSSGAEGLSEGAGLAPPSSRRSVSARSQDVQDALRRPEPAAERHRCHGRRCRRAAWELRELGPSCSSYPHFGPCEWSWGSPGSTSPCQLAADCQRCHGMRCRRAAWEERELGPSCWGRTGAADFHTCNGSPWAIRLELELWPSGSSYPDLGPYEWSWERPRSTSRCREHCPACPRAHRF